MQHILATNNLSYSYTAGRELRFPDMACRANEPCLLMGASGCGKTTLLHLIAGLRKPHTGSIKIDGQDIVPLTNAKVDKIRGKSIGIVFQQPYFIQSLTVFENLQLARTLNGMKASKSEIYEQLDHLGIAHKIDDYPSKLSEGEKQRLSVLRAIMNAPRLILADEPTSSLDDKHAAEVAALLKHQAEIAAASLLIVTHDRRLTEFFGHIIEL